MSVERLRELCSALEAVQGSESLDQVEQTVDQLQRSLFQLGSLRPTAGEDGQAIVEALARLKHVLDDMTSVYGRKARLVGEELSVVTRSAKVARQYQDQP